MTRPLAKLGVLQAQAGPFGPDRAERVATAAAEEEPAPAWLNSAFAAQAIGQRHPVEPAPTAAGYSGARRLRPGVAFDLST